MNRLHPLDDAFLKPSRPAPARRRRRPFAQGFTLIEMLMVCAILAVVTAITVPSLVRSIRGNRLRAASRTVIQMGRYARSMAVLRQQDMALSFDLQARRITVAPAGRTYVRASGGAESDAEPEPGVPALFDASADEAVGSPSGTAGTGLGGEEPVSRALDQVIFEAISLGGDADDEDGETVREGACMVVYAGNGRCRPYSVVLRDEFGAAVRIEVDALASARTEAFETGVTEP